MTSGLNMISYQPYSPLMGMELCWCHSSAMKQEKLS